MNETKMNEVCAICLDTISSSKATISCGHTFCTECLLLSSLNNKNCPMCRKDIYSDSNKKIYAKNSRIPLPRLLTTSDNIDWNKL